MFDQPEFIFNANSDAGIMNAGLAAGEFAVPVPKKHIKGIACDVQNCGYNDGNGGCTAEKIAVGPSSAASCTDTVCATFKPKAKSNLSV